MTFNETLGMIMLFGMVAVIFIGFPISFTLLFLALVFGGFGLGWEQTFDLAYLQIWGTMKDEISGGAALHLHGLHDGAGRPDGAAVPALATYSAPCAARSTSR